jgi:copper chaperone CopZ
MTTQVYSVPNISCGHCVATIERELKLVDGVESVKAELDTRRVTVQTRDDGVLPLVEETLVEIGYPAQ